MRLIQAINFALLTTVCFTGLTAVAADGPVLPKSKGEMCVEPVDIMRRNHFEFILHIRDETVYKGIRTSKYSLVECINCHVLPDDKQEFVSHESEEHFCTSCHAFASVKIDCFECHSDKPNSSPGRNTDSGKGQHPSGKEAPSQILNSSLIASSLKTLKAKHQVVKGL